MNNGLPDIIADGLDVLFCGINPGLKAAATGHHFAGNGNRFWRVLHESGFTPEQLTPDVGRLILRYGCGLTTVVARPTSGADELSPAEFTAASASFRRKLARHAPRCVAFLGKVAYAGLTGQRNIPWGKQEATMEGAQVWVLPNPSGRNRAFSLDALVSAYRELRGEIDATTGLKATRRPRA